MFQSQPLGICAHATPNYAYPLVAQICHSFLLFTTLRNAMIVHDLSSRSQSVSHVVDDGTPPPPLLLDAQISWHLSSTMPNVRNRLNATRPITLTVNAFPSIAANCCFETPIGNRNKPVGNPCSASISDNVIILLRCTSQCPPSLQRLRVRQGLIIAAAAERPELIPTIYGSRLGSSPARRISS